MKAPVWRIPPTLADREFQSQEKQFGGKDKFIIITESRDLLRLQGVYEPTVLLTWLRKMVFAWCFITPCFSDGDIVNTVVSLSVCLPQSCWVFIHLYRMQSLAKSYILYWMQSGRLFMKFRNRKGPKICVDSLWDAFFGPCWLVLLV